MKNSYPVAIVIVTAALSALLLAPVPGLAQAPAPAQAGDTADDKAKAARAKRIAERFERDARVLTVFDRQGKVVTTVGERAIYEDPVFSPDRTRLAVSKFDLESETVDLWVLDMATGNSTRITSSQTRPRLGFLPIPGSSPTCQTRSRPRYLRSTCARLMPVSPRPAQEARATVEKRQPRRSAFRVHHQCAGECDRALRQISSPART